jgi:hypothetical protein
VLFLDDDDRADPVGAREVRSTIASLTAAARPSC